MEIIHIAAELAPVAKVGGLGDVISGLSRALVEKGHQVEVFLPKYDCLELSGLDHLEVTNQNFTSYFDGKWHQNRIWKGLLHGFTVLLFESYDPHGFFERDKVYGEHDDNDRFLNFCRATLDYIQSQNRKPDILHVHDWHAAAIPLLQKHLYPDLTTKTVLTIHNLAYQGFTERKILEKIGLPPQIFPKEWVNLLELGIIYADHITTVSPTYAKEILTKEGGHGLEKVLQKYSDKLSGILNGIDEKFWNPETDPILPYHYNAHEIKKEKPPFIENKVKLQSHTRRMFSLQEKRCPIVGCVTRLVHQKGPELIKDALYWTLQNGGQFILLAAASDPKTHQEFYQIKREVMDTQFAHIELTYNENLSHLVYGAADILIVPSIFEPCGLTQMIAMRYGTVPLVRKTGGLADTVFDGENGFTFGPPTKEALTNSLEKAFHTWFSEPHTWQKLVENGMNHDFSWNRSAEKYIELYEKLQKVIPFPEKINS